MQNPTKALQFSESWLASSTGQRRFDRLTCSWPASCYASGMDRFDATVIDISEGGFGLVGPDFQMEAGGELYIDFQNIGTFFCRLAWRQGPRFGVEILDGQGLRDPERDAALVAALNGLERQNLARQKL